MQDFMAGLSRDLSASAALVRSLFSGTGERGIMTEQWFSVFLSFAIVVAAAVLALLVFRVVAAKLFDRANAWVAHTPVIPAEAKPPSRLAPGGTAWLASIGMSRKGGAVMGALVLDIAVIVLAAIVGYAVFLIRPIEYKTAGTFEFIFLNAFVAIELVKALSRAVFAKRHEQLRLLPMSNTVARYWGDWFAVLIGLIGYGLLVAVPLVKALLTPSIGQLLGLFIMLGVYVYAVRVIWGHRHLLRQRLIVRAEHASAAFFSALIRMLARVWHVLAIAYFTVLLVVSQTDQQGALLFMAKATFQTLAAVALGALLASVLSSLLMHGILLWDDLRQRLPMLEARLNSYVPATIKALRAVILVAIMLVVLDAWHAFDLTNWIYSDSGRSTIAMILHVAIILFAAAFVWTVVASVIESRLSAAVGQSKPTEREKTLLSLFRNAALVVILTMTILIVLSQIGINIGPLIAGAGVAGLAIGFGAQKLVQDVITGVFIQLENGMNQNDVVELCGLFGTVEKITIRSVVIRTLDGGYHLIPFSTVDKLTNHMRGFGYHYGEYTIAHRESADDVIVHLKRAFEEFMQEPALACLVLEDISIPGVTSLSERGFTVRVLIKTVAGAQWEVQRGYNRLVKQHFNAAGIELPYPQTVVHFAQEKNGDTTPLNVRGLVPNTV